MIRFITGKPGDGKSLFATRQLIQDLIQTDVFVVTNIPLRFPELRAYVAHRAEKLRRRNDPEYVFDLDSRVKVLTDDDVYEFYRFRSGGLTLAPSPDFVARDNPSARLERPDFTKAMKAEFMRVNERPEYQRPVHFYIDEAHNFFSAREWATTSRSLLYYASQHRHLHDEIILITQVIENVEKQLRGLVSETDSCRNYMRRSVGFFKMRPVFKVRGFYGVPTPQMKPYAVTTLDLDAKGVAACYKTVGALGVHSSAEGVRNRGFLPWWFLWTVAGLGIAALAAAFWFGPRMLAKHVGGAMDARMNGKSISAVSHVLGSSPTPVAAVSGGSTLVQPSADVFPTGYAIRGSKLNVVLSDGSVVIEGDPRLQRLTRAGVFLDGHWQPFRPTVAPSPAVAVSAPSAPLPAPPDHVPVSRSEGPWTLDPDGVLRLPQGFEGRHPGT